MATDLEKLVVQLSADIKGYEVAMRKAVGVTNTQARAIESRHRKSAGIVAGIMRQLGRSVITPLAGIGAALSVREVGRYADAWTRAGNQIAAAAQLSGREGRSLEEINQIADSARAGFTETADLYARLLRATGKVAKSELEVARATEIVSKAFKAGGAAASEQAAGVLQLGQALGSGFLAGDELRSIRENAPLIAQAIAEEFGVTIAGLKDLGAAGELTSDRVFQAILKAQPKIEAAFGRTNSTIQEGMTRVNNAFVQYIGQTDSSLSASARLTAGLSALADNFDNIADVTLKVAAIIAGALVGRSIAGMVVKLGLATTAAIKFVASLRAAISLSGVATAIGGISAAAGPIGLVVGGVAVAALTAFSASSGEAGEASERLEARIKRIADQAEDTATRVEAAAVRIGEALPSEINKITQDMSKADKEIASLIEEIIAWINQFEQLGLERGFTDEAIAELARLRVGVEDGTIAAEDARQALFDLANGNYAFQELADKLNPLLSRLANVRTAALELIQLQDLVVTAPGFTPPARPGTSEDEAAARRAGQEYLADAARQNALTADQLALETEIAKVRKDMPEGALLTEAQINALAKANLAADAARRSATSGGASQNEMQREAARIIEETRTAAEKYGNELKKLNTLLQADAIDQDTYNRAVAKLGEELETVSGLGKDAAAAIRSAFDGLFDDPKQALKDLAIQLAKLALYAWLGKTFPTAFGAKGFVPLVTAASGGHVSGAGSGTSDSIPAMLSDGEFVVNAAATRKNLRLLEAINSGTARGFASGGQVTMPKMASGPTPTQVVQSVEVHNYTGAPVREERKTGPDGREMVRVIVGEEMARGAFDGQQRARYGAKPQGVVR